MHTTMQPRAAATVILVRSASDAGLEVLLVRRSRRSAFAPDAYVFPGGALDERDREGALPMPEPRIAESALLPSPLPRPDPLTLGALRIAAARELLEEAGIVLARSQGVRESDGVVAPEIRAAIRASLRNGRPSFVHVVTSFGLRPATEELVLFSRWITPPDEPRRFDAYFFVARTPDGQVATADAIETHDGLWLAPGEALAQYAIGRLHLVYPTIKHLERLAAFDDVDALLEFAARKPIVTIAPDRSPERGFSLPLSLEGSW